MMLSRLLISSELSLWVDFPRAAPPVLVNSEEDVAEMITFPPAFKNHIKWAEHRGSLK